MKTNPNAPGRRRSVSNLPRQVACVIVVVIIALQGEQVRGADPSVESIVLPALRIDGQSATAHTQGLEVFDGKFHVTAQRDDVRPKRALLLRVVPSEAGWTAWDITPTGKDATLDHPGGLQSDGTRLWIPLAESKPHGRSLIRAFRIRDMKAGRSLQAEFEFAVDDHIGAVAVVVGRQLLLGANWDTEKVYAWDFKGRLKWTLAGAVMKDRGLGFVDGVDGRAGVTVQDWKMVGDRLYASGLFRSPESASVPPASRWCWFERFYEADSRRTMVTLPPQAGVELAKEAMAIAGGSVYFLPNDLNASNRIFRISLAALTQEDARRRLHPSPTP